MYVEHIGRVVKLLVHGFDVALDLLMAFDVSNEKFPILRRDYMWERLIIIYKIGSLVKCAYNQGKIC